jgi:triosephosphate isomerase
MRLLCANWKMNLGLAESAKLAKDLAALDLTKTQVWAACTTAALSSCAESTHNSQIKIGAQNAYFESKGAFTGELSAGVLLETGASFSLVGHSERRNIFLEDNSLCTKRAIGLLNSGVDVIFCVGEKIEERQLGEDETAKVINSQLNELLQNLPEGSSCGKLIFAYEPVWAIGTGLSATIQQIEQVHLEIQNIWTKSKSGKCPPILYGGSVSKANAEEILLIPSVAGALVGGASNSFESFNALIQISEKLA